MGGPGSGRHGSGDSGGSDKSEQMAHANQLLNASKKARQSGNLALSDRLHQKGMSIKKRK